MNAFDDAFTEAVIILASGTDSIQQRLRRAVARLPRHLSTRFPFAGQRAFLDKIELLDDNTASHTAAELVRVALDLRAIRHTHN